jgi:hypothetical protein
MSTKPLSRTVALAFAGAATAALTVASAPAAQADPNDPNYVDACDLSKTVTELQQYGSNDSNIVVYRADHAETENFEGVVRQGEIKEYGCDEVTIVGKRTFKWVEFTGEGEFVRKGDGGYRNWAFAGVYDRDDNRLTFHAR